MAAKYPPEMLARRAEEHPPTREEIRIAMRLAENTASRWRAGLECQGIDQEDLLGEAYAAAWQALLTFDPERGMLSTHVIGHCRHAVLEALRRADPLTRAERRAHKEAQKASPGHRPPRTFLSLEDLLMNLDKDGASPPEWVDWLGAWDPALLDLPERLDTESIAAIALRAVHGAEAEVIEQCVMGEKTLKEEGKAMDRCETRVKQLRAQALARMRLALLVTP